LHARTVNAGSSIEGLKGDLVAANRVLARHRVLDGFGHVSARDPRHRDRFLLSRSLAPALVTVDDLMSFDFDANALDGDARRPYLERFIHAAIYRARPDVNAVVHSHSPSVIPFAASSVPLRPIYHMASFLGPATPVFEIRERFGATDMLVRNVAQGEALAQRLGEGSVVLMRGHGFCAVGDSLAVVVYRAIYTESNAALQQAAIALGGSVTYLDGEESRLSDASNRGVIERPWELWKSELDAKRD
jgi:ribulose-5-phosphate 4-epimerase/fuculose-1-phosphate aldolase